jgi:hypothetical protein
MGLSLLLPSKLDQRIYVPSRYMVRGLGPLYNFFLVTLLPHRIALKYSWYPHSIAVEDLWQGVKHGILDSYGV